MLNSTSTSQPETRIDIRAEARGAYKGMGAFDASIELDAQLRELINVRASCLNGCAFCVDMHTRAALKRGEDERRLHAVAAWPEAPFFSDSERAALALTDALTMVAEAGVPDEIWEEASRHFSDEELGQLVMAISAINAWNRIAVGVRLLPRDLSDSGS